MRAAASAFSSGCQRAGRPQVIPASVEGEAERGADEPRGAGRRAGQGVRARAYLRRAAPAAGGQVGRLRPGPPRAIFARRSLQLARAAGVVPRARMAHREVAGVVGAHRAHAHRGHRDAGRHLHGGEQRVEAAPGASWPGARRSRAAWCARPPRPPGARRRPRRRRSRGSPRSRGLARERARPPRGCGARRARACRRRSRSPRAPARSSAIAGRSLSLPMRIATTRRALVHGRLSAGACRRASAFWPMSLR